MRDMFPYRIWGEDMKETEGGILTANYLLYPLLSRRQSTLVVKFSVSDELALTRVPIYCWMFASHGYWSFVIMLLYYSWFHLPPCYKSPLCSGCIDLTAESKYWWLQHVIKTLSHLFFFFSWDLLSSFPFQVVFGFDKLLVICPRSNVLICCSLSIPGACPMTGMFPGWLRGL